MIWSSEPSRERVKVSHVIVECRMINHHPGRTASHLIFAEAETKSFVINFDSQAAIMALGNTKIKSKLSYRLSTCTQQTVIEQPGTH